MHRVAFVNDSLVMVIEPRKPSSTAWLLKIVEARHADTPLIANDSHFYFDICSCDEYVMSRY